MIEAIDLVCQIVITVAGVSAIFLVARKSWVGFLLGLISQPFWLATSIIHRQWGIAILSFVYAINWAYGLINWRRGR